jgi:hypothetical protein
MPCAHRALRLFRSINHRSVQRSRRWGALRSEIKEEAAGRGTFAEQGTPSAGAHPEPAGAARTKNQTTGTRTESAGFTWRRYSINVASSPQTAAAVIHRPGAPLSPVISIRPVAMAGVKPPNSAVARL